VPRHIARLVTRLVAPLLIDYSGLVVDYFASAARLGASARRAAHHVARRAAHRRLLRARRRPLRLHRASECLGTSRGSSRGSSRRSSSTTPGSSSTTSPLPRVRVPRHVAWLVTRLVAPLIVDYSGLVVDYFASAAHPGASARGAARRVARRRLLHLRRASGCLGTSRGWSCGSSRRSSSTTSPPPRVRVPRHVARLVLRLVAPLVVDYFAYAARLGASACRAAHRLLSTTPPRAGSSSTTLPTPRVWVPRHIARLIACR
jgi:hypothetical protein